MYGALSVLLILCTFGQKAFSNLQESDPKCRYRVHYPKASWHTAYDVCSGENKTLAKISSQIELQLVELVLVDVETLIKELDVKTDLQGVWIEGFRRSSNNESMQQNCQSLDPQFNIIMTYPAEDDILCLYYNYTSKKFYADNCNAERAFLCESLTTDLENCMMTNNIASVINDIPNGICELRSSTTTVTLVECIAGCLNDDRCYGVLNDTACKHYMYKEGPCNFPRYTEFFIHKGLFIYHSTPPLVAATKPFKKWCPEITQEIIQEKIENIQKNLTVNKKETNQYIRTLTSAPDERQSAKNIGIVGVTVISVVFGVIILSDCINVVKGIQNKCKKSEVS